MRDFDGFAGVLSGVTKKWGWLAWFFAGDFVVVCVTNVV
jgi:hypothetical protein